MLPKSPRPGEVDTLGKNLVFKLYIYRYIHIFVSLYKFDNIVLQSSRKITQHCIARRLPPDVLNAWALMAMQMIRMIRNSGMPTVTTPVNSSFSDDGDDKIRCMPPHCLEGGNSVRGHGNRDTYDIYDP